MFRKSDLARLWSDEGGASTVELGILITFVAVAALASMEILGGSISGLFESTGNEIDNVRPAAGDE